MEKSLIQALSKEMSSRHIPQPHLDSLLRDVEKTFKKHQEQSTLLSGMFERYLPSWGGVENLYDVRSLFKGGFDEDYIRFGLNQKQRVLKEGFCISYCMKEKRPATGKEMFHSFGYPLKSMCLPQNRIVQILTDTHEAVVALRKDLFQKDKTVQVLLTNQIGKKMVNQEQCFFVLDISFKKEKPRISFYEFASKISQKGNNDNQLLIRQFEP